MLDLLSLRLSNLEETKMKLTRRTFVKATAATAATTPLLGAECISECASDPACVEAVVSLTVVLIKLSFAIAEAINAETTWVNHEDFSRTIKVVIDLVDVASGLVVDSVERGVELEPGDQAVFELGGVSSQAAGEYQMRFTYLDEEPVESETLTIQA